MKVCAVGYARTSSYLNPRASIPNQCKLIREYCETNNIFLKEIYIDESKTATTVEGREGYLKMKSDIENGDIDMVIVSFFDRLAREAFEFILTVIDLNKKGVGIVSISDDLSSTKMSPIHLAMIAFEIEHENKQRTERIHSAIKDNRRKGIYNIPHIPLGYIKDRNGMLAIEPQKAILVKEIFEFYIFTKSFYETVGRFTEVEGLKENMIKTILENKTYTGFIYKKKQKNNSIEYIQESFVSHPSLIDDETFEKARLIREQDQKRAKRITKPYLLKYLFKCPKCHKSIDSGKGKYTCGRCKDAGMIFDQEVLENEFINWISIYSGQIKYKRTEEYSECIYKIEKEKRKLEENYSKAKISLTEFQVKVNHLNEQIVDFNKAAYSSDDFKAIYEIKKLIRKKAWLRLRKIMVEEKMYITLNEELCFVLLNNK
ncbi:recombinase family protein [Bacillus infantis]|uniref:recombinase family protein n=1 Tax=Bacillus infantis TaxID=324767 RepID=UPI003CEF4F57